MTTNSNPELTSVKSCRIKRPGSDQYEELAPFLCEMYNRIKMLEEENKKIKLILKTMKLE